MTRGENFCDPALHPRNMEIMTEHGPCPAPETRLMRIDFPRMKIEDEAAAFAARLPKRPSCVPLGKNSEITAAGGRKIPRAQPNGGRRKLEEVAPLAAGPLERSLRRVRHSVDIVMDGEDAGIVKKTLLRENLQRPKRLFDDRETGRSIAYDGLAAGVLDGCAGATCIGAKLVGREMPDAAVPVAMAGDLVPGGDNLAHDLREAFGNPSEHEKCGLGSVPAEQVENAAGVVHNARGMGRPAFRRNTVVKGFHVEVVLDVHTESVRKGPRKPARDEAGTRNGRRKGRTGHGS